MSQQSATLLSCTAIYDFQARSEREVSIKSILPKSHPLEGDILIVINADNKDWTCVKDSSGKVGYVPFSMIKLNQLDQKPVQIETTVLVDKAPVNETIQLVKSNDDTESIPQRIRRNAVVPIKEKPKEVFELEKVVQAPEKVEVLPTQTVNVIVSPIQIQPIQTETTKQFYPQQTVETQESVSMKDIGPSQTQLKTDTPSIMYPNQVPIVQNGQQIVYLTTQIQKQVPIVQKGQQQLYQPMQGQQKTLYPQQQNIQNPNQNIQQGGSFVQPKPQFVNQYPQQMQQNVQQQYYPVQQQQHVMYNQQGQMIYQQPIQYQQQIQYQQPVQYQQPIQLPIQYQQQYQQPIQYQQQTVQQQPIYYPPQQQVQYQPPPQILYPQQQQPQLVQNQGGFYGGSMGQMQPQKTQSPQQFYQPQFQPIQQTPQQSQPQIQGQQISKSQSFTNFPIQQQIQPTTQTIQNQSFTQGTHQGNQGIQQNGQVLQQNIDKRNSMQAIPINQPQIIQSQAFQQQQLPQTIVNLPISRTVPLGKKVELDRKYTGYKLNFNAVFSVRTLQDGFMKHLDDESTQEPFEFILECSRMPNKVTKEIVDHFIQVVEVYIVESSKKSVNISGKDRNPIMAVYKEQKSLDIWTHTTTPRWVLEQARKVAYNDLRFDAWPRFTGSEAGYKLICALSDNPDVISQSPLYSVLYKLQDTMDGEEDKLKSLAGDLSDVTKLKATYFSTTSVELPKDCVREFNMDISPVIDPLMRYNIKLKLIVSENLLPKSRSLHSLLVNKINQLSDQLQKEEDEPFIWGVIIGPWVLQWDDNDVCIPKIMETNLPSNVIFCCDLNEIFYFKQVEDMIASVSTTIVQWNVNREFKVRPTDKERFGNSKDFVDSLLLGLGLRLNLPYFTNLFLGTLSMKSELGNAKLSFEYKYDFQSRFGLNNPVTQFKTHADIDNFISKLLFVEPNFQNVRSAEWHYLKGIDRGFWLRYLAIKMEIDELKAHLDPNDKKTKKYIATLESEIKPFTPNMTKEGVVVCPCKHPARTKSFCLKL